MTDDFITKREFDGFGNSVREEFRAVNGGLSNVLAKIDTLLNGRIQEAQLLGEMSGAIRAINERLERQEREVAEVRRVQQQEVTELKGDINALRTSQTEQAQGKIGWFMNLVLVIIAAFAGAFLAKVWK